MMRQQLSDLKYSTSAHYLGRLHDMQMNNTVKE